MFSQQMELFLLSTYTGNLSYLINFILEIKTRLKYKDSERGLI